MSIVLNEVEIRIAHQALNECLHGFGMETAGGVSFGSPEGLRVMSLLGQQLRDSRPVDLQPDDAATIASALDATFRELDWDYSVRMGVELSEARSLRERLDAATLPGAEDVDR